MGVSIFKSGGKKRGQGKLRRQARNYGNQPQDTVAKAVDATEGDATHSQKGK